MKDNSSKQILLSVLGVAILVVAVVGVSFAAFTYTGTGTKENTISTGTIAMNYSEDSDGISITDAMPMTDDAGKALTDASGAGTKNTFKFSLSATITGTTTIGYEISAKKDAASTLANADIRLYLATVSGANEVEAMAPKAYTPIATATDIGTPAGSMILASGNVTATQTTNYVLKMWVPTTYVVTGTAKTFTVTVDVYAKAA